MLDRSIIEDHLARTARAHIAHYTRIGTLSPFIPPGAISWESAWATPVQFLNDRAELSLGLKVLAEAATDSKNFGRKSRAILTRLLITAGRPENDAFQMSFSGNPDELGQWRGYAANGMGCSVITDAVAVKAVADVAGWVIYDAAEQTAFARKVLDRLKSERNDDLIEQTLVAAACFMKHQGFRPEEEFRLLKFPDAAHVGFRETTDRLVPYTDFLKSAGAELPLEKIVIGPGWQLAGLKTAEWAKNHVVQGIDRLLSARGLHAVEITCSEIPYDPK